MNDEDFFIPKESIIFLFRQCKSCFWLFENETGKHCPKCGNKSSRVLSHTEPQDGSYEKLLTEQEAWMQTPRSEEEIAEARKYAGMLFTMVHRL